MPTIHRTFVLKQDSHAEALYAFLRANRKAMADAGTPLAVTVSEHKAKRSTPQNARYWGVVLKQIAENGWVDGKQFSTEAWHAYLAAKFIGTEEGPGGQQTPISTTTLDVGSFADFMTQCEAFAASELGLEIL